MPRILQTTVTRYFSLSIAKAINTFTHEINLLRECRIGKPRVTRPFHPRPWSRLSKRSVSWIQPRKELPVTARYIYFWILFINRDM